MTHAPEDVDVLVVGAGPSGLALGLLLAARGLRTLVVEAKSTTSDEPKAISLDDESLRILQQAGIADDVLSIIVPGTGTRYYDRNGRPAFSARAEIPGRLGYPFKNPFAQPDLERVLAGAYERFPDAELRFGHRLTGIVQDTAGVTATVEGPDGAAEIRAGIAVGADGGRSTVRTLIGIDMVGESFETPWLVIDTRNDPHSERYGMHHGDPARPHVIVPGLDGRCRYEFLLHPGEGLAGGTAPFDLMHRLVAPYRDLRPEDVERAVIYVFHAIVAERWQEGRILLVGDAAHMMPPFAGQGLNSGLRDVGNLAWKIADVLHGRAPFDILASYEIERRPHAEATVRLSAKLGRVVMTTSHRLAAFRDERIRAALAGSEGRDYFEHMRYRPRLHLDDGLILPGRAPDLVGTALAQPRVFDGAAHRTALLDEVLGPGWAILGVDVDGRDWTGVRGVAADSRALLVHADTHERFPRDIGDAVPVIDLDGRLDEELGPFRGRFLLVRPDRVVAAAWLPEESAAVEAAVRDWFACPAAAPLPSSPPPHAAEPTK